MKTQSYALFTLLSAVVLVFCSNTPAQSWTAEQIKQIEEIAQTIASQHNANSKALLDDMTVSSRAIAVSRNVRLKEIEGSAIDTGQ